MYHKPDTNDRCLAQVVKSTKRRGQNKKCCIDENGGEFLSKNPLGHFGPNLWDQKNSPKKNCRKRAKIIKIALLVAFKLTFVEKKSSNK